MKVWRRAATIALLFACQACATPVATGCVGEVCSGNSLPNEVEVQLHDLPMLRLERDHGPSAPLRQDALPDHWRLRRGVSGALVDPDGNDVIVGSFDAPMVDIAASPDGRRWLVHHGSGRYVVYDRDGSHAQAIPMFRFPGAGTVAWHWKDSSSLVGVVDFSDWDGKPRYPDSDVLPSSTSFVLYRSEQGTNTLYALDAPKPHGTLVLRIEGVTAQGGLLLSEVSAQEYYGGAPERELGVYDLSGDRVP